MPTWITIGNAILGWLTARIKVVLFVAVVAALIIWNPRRWEQYTHLDWLFVPHLWVAWLVFVPCVLWLAYCLLFWIGESSLTGLQSAYRRYHFERLFKE